MSVAMMLGVDDPQSPVMVAARSGWKVWTARDPDFGVVKDLLDLPNWTLDADNEQKDAVLRALARWGAVNGGNDSLAITALTWLLVPGAATVAYRLRDLASNIDELVASHLWTSAKTFAWDRRRATAASILRDTRQGVLAEVGVGDPARRQDRTWTVTRCVQPESPTWTTFAEDEPPESLFELTELLDDALCAHALTNTDCELLLDLAITADRVGTPGHRGRGGLMVPAISEEIGRRRGMSARTVRRHASQSIDRLTRFAAQYGTEQPAAVATHTRNLAVSA